MLLALTSGSNVMGYYYGGGGTDVVLATTILGTRFATVGPGFTITLKNKKGVVISHIRPGTFNIEVDDKSSVHNFHLTGQGVNKATTVSQITKVTWTVTFVAGKIYTYVCDPHSNTMKGQFTVKTS